MIKARYGNEEVTIKKLKIIPDSLTIENVLVDYVGRKKSKPLVNGLKNFINNNLIVAKICLETYQMVFNNGKPSFEEQSIEEKIRTFLISAGFEKEDAKECAIALFNAIAKDDVDEKYTCDLLDSTSEESFQQPKWIPDGFKHYMGNIDTGYVVKDANGNEFTYFKKKDVYISRHQISKGKMGIPKSIPWKFAWTDINYLSAKKVAKSFATNVIHDDLNYVSDIFCVGNEKGFRIVLKRKS